MSLGYLSFRHIYLKTLPKKFGKLDRKRISKLTLPDDVEEEEHKEGPIPFLIHRKKDSVPFGILFDIHGGGWCYGDKELNRPFNMSMASRNLLVISMDYRLIGKAEVKEQVQDVIDCMVDVYQRKEELHLDFTLPVFLTGDSAGGMLASIVTAVSENEEYQTIYSRKLPFRFTSLVLNHPAGYTSRFDELFALPKPFRKKINGYFSTLMYGKEYTKNPVYLSSADFSSIAKKVKFPKTMIITSIGDTWLRKMSDRQYHDMIENHDDVTLITYEDEPNCHVFNVMYINSEAGKKANDDIKGFLQKSVDLPSR